MLRSARNNVYPDKNNHPPWSAKSSSRTALPLRRPADTRRSRKMSCAHYFADDE